MFIEQTFHNNQAALACTFAALSLALSGENIDRVFWSIGPGGVGQSLYSYLIHVVCAGAHSFFDTNIFYSDEELRKQVESLVNKVVMTGQEAVGGS